MRGSWRLTRVAGIDVSVHWSFLLLLGWVLFASLSAGLFAAVREVAFVAAVFVCVVLHELGHAMAARLFGIPTHGITLLPIGGIAQLDRIPRNPGQELVIALAGPMVNVLIATILLPVAIAIEGFAQLSAAGWLDSGLVVRLLAVNVGLVVFNLIPAFPMDGGRVLRAVLALGTDYVTATHWAARVGQFMAVLFGLAGLFLVGNPMLLLIAMFIFFAAEGERQAVQRQARHMPFGVTDPIDVTPHGGPRWANPHHADPASPPEVTVVLTSPSWDPPPRRFP